MVRDEVVRARLPKETKDALMKEANELGITLSALVVMVITKHVRKK